jgi:hypothetical protein
MDGQRVEMGSTHQLRAEATSDDGTEWGGAFDWYVDSAHLAVGPEFSWTPVGPEGDHRVTLVVTGKDGSWTWVHVDVQVASGDPQGPPRWLEVTADVLPLAALVTWLALLYRWVMLPRRRQDD